MQVNFALLQWTIFWKIYFVLESGILGPEWKLLKRRSVPFTATERTAAQSYFCPFSYIDEKSLQAASLCHNCRRSKRCFQVSIDPDMVLVLKSTLEDRLAEVDTIYLLMNLGSSSKRRCPSRVTFRMEKLLVVLNSLYRRTLSVILMIGTSKKPSRLVIM